MVQVAEKARFDAVRARQPAWRLSRAMRATVRAALRPWSRLSPPERARACSMLSQVITPKAQGTPVASCTFWMPRAASAQTKS